MASFTLNETCEQFSTFNSILGTNDHWIGSSYWCTVYSFSLQINFTACQFSVECDALKSLVQHSSEKVNLNAKQMLFLPFWIVYHTSVLLEAHCYSHLTASKCLLSLSVSISCYDERTDTNIADPNFGIFLCPESGTNNKTKIDQVINSTLFRNWMGVLVAKCFSWKKEDIESISVLYLTDYWSQFLEDWFQ